MSKQNDKYLDNVEEKTFENNEESQGAGNTSKLQEIQSKSIIKLSSKHIDYLIANFDLEKYEAIKILRKNNGDFEKSLDQLLLGTDCLGTPEYVI